MLDMLHARWTLVAMQKDALNRGLPASSKPCARYHCPHDGVKAPDLATVKVFFFFFFFATTSPVSHDKIVNKSTSIRFTLILKRIFASLARVTDTEIHCCYQCFEWVVGEHWSGHRQEHLPAIASKQCGSVTYCYTLVRSGYCSFHLGNQRLLASERGESWSRDRKL
jgi:hypothetical protein